MTTYIQRPRHFHDPWIQHDAIVWHNDPNFEQVMVDLIERVRPSCFVETGSHMGWTSVWIAEHFPWLPIYTVEIHERYQTMARENLAPYPWACAKEGQSIPFLEALKPVLERGTPLFWLDAHWWPPVPLRDECKIVASLPRYVAVIDDFEVKNPDFGGDGGEESFGYKMCNHEYVAEFLGKRCWRPSYENTRPNEWKGYGIFTKPPAATKWVARDGDDGYVGWLGANRLLKESNLP